MTSPSSSNHRLTDTQLVMLSQASQRADGKVVPPAHLRGGVIQRVMASLAGKGLIQPRPSDGRTDVNPDCDYAEACPVISSAGLAALGITDDAVPSASGVNDATPVDAKGDAGAPAGTVERPATALATSDGHPLEDGAEAVRAGSQANPDAIRLPRAGSKQAMVLELLARPGGASLDEVMSATGWLSHTARAVLSGLRKRGHGIERMIGGEGGSRYRLASFSTSAA